MDQRHFKPMHCLLQYFGPAKDARQYFTDLGFAFNDRQTTADALTSVTDPFEVRYREGFEKKAPRTPEARVKAFKESQRYKQNLADIEIAAKEVTILFPALS